MIINKICRNIEKNMVNNFNRHERKTHRFAPSVSSAFIQRHLLFCFDCFCMRTAYVARQGRKI